MGKVSNRMWKLLGAQTSKNQSKTVALVGKSSEFDSWAAELDDDAIATEAAELDVASDNAEARAKYLALARVAASRSLGLTPFDVQLQGAVRILDGDIAEMATGEGKTLTGAIAAAGFALSGRSVHVVSVNDYLANRDATAMKPFFDLLGVTVGAISEQSTRAERHTAYAAQVLYGSVNEIGFDVLRDQLVTRAEDLISPTPDVAIIDEADSVLVDEALIPLVLAGSVRGEVPAAAVLEVVNKLRKGQHYEIDTDGRNVSLTDEGAALVEEEMGGINLYDEEHVGTTLVQVNVALHATVLVERDVHYIVRGGEVKLINASRGRIAELQRWPDGLQAAVEAKEGLVQTDGGEVIDTITVQALLQRYPIVCGMTGTAIAAGEQLRQFYDLGVSQIEPNTPNVRVDQPIRVYDNKANKAAAIVEFVAQIHETGQPILIGTHDVAESEELAHLLHRAGVESKVLNAKNDAEEAAIIAEAGARDAVTVSTQMAGRGTDIKLGGTGADEDPELREAVVELGGLLVLGTGLHDTERLDLQLRGRSGRQGDPGESIFFASIEDPLVTKHLPLKRLPTNADAESGLFPPGKAGDVLEQAQRVAEGVMLETHANTWRYNKLVNQQRDIVVARRTELLSTDAPLQEFKKYEPERFAELVGAGTVDADADAVAVDADAVAVDADAVAADADAEAEVDAVADADAEATLEAKAAGIDEKVLEQAAREAFLFHLDRAWAEHLALVSDVQASIHLRALGRESPLDEFHREVVSAFSALPGEAIDRARETLRTATITADGIDLEANNLDRNTLTWTYMVHDNPFTSAAARGFEGIVGMIR